MCDLALLLADEKSFAKQVDELSATDLTRLIKGLVPKIESSGSEREKILPVLRDAIFRLTSNRITSKQELCWRVGSVVRIKRIQKDMTYEELAQASEVPVVVIKNQEVGKRCAELPELLMLSQALGTDLTDLFIEAADLLPDSDEEIDAQLSSILYADPSAVEAKR